MFRFDLMEGRLYSIMVVFEKEYEREKEKAKASESQEGEAGFRYQICVSDKTWAEMLQNQKKEFLDGLAFHIWGRRAGQGTKLAVAKLICEHVKQEKVLLGYLLNQDSMRVLHWMSRRRDGELLGWDVFPCPAFISSFGKKHGV